VFELESRAVTSTMTPCSARTAHGWSTAARRWRTWSACSNWSRCPRKSTTRRRRASWCTCCARCPRPTDSVEYEGMRFELLDVDHYRIDQLLV